MGLHWSVEGAILLQTASAPACVSSLQPASWISDLAASTIPWANYSKERTYIQLIFIICRFCIYEFAYSLKFICNPNIHTRGAFSHSQTWADGKDLSRLMCLFPAEVQWGDILPSCFSSPPRSVSFRNLFGTTFCAGFSGAFCQWFHCLKGSPGIVPKCCLEFPSAESLWCALCKKYAC